MGRSKAKKVVQNGRAPDNGRHPRSTQASNVPTAKRPRREFTPQDADDKLIILFSRVDVEGPWCLTKITIEHHVDLLGHIRSFESMTVNQVFSQDGKAGMDYAIEKLPTRAAKDRIFELELDDRDTISRLRVGGKQRLYGFREGSRFYVLWWDPEHEIWPSAKRHT